MGLLSKNPSRSNSIAAEILFRHSAGRALSRWSYKQARRQLWPAAKLRNWKPGTSPPEKFGLPIDAEISALKNGVVAWMQRCLAFGRGETVEGWSAELADWISF
jgi:hypothetical protein